MKEAGLLDTMRLQTNRKEDILTTETGSIPSLINDARSLHRSAVAQIENQDLRDAAEKAWCATKRATDALILFWTGAEPEYTSVTTREIDRLSQDDAGIADLADRYRATRDRLHGDCFYKGFLDNPSVIERNIHRVADYIETVEQMIGL